ncbi:hypothetical protein DICVIV_05751 [Dictyocaulus viviparus]|uniref:Uncharacterized protein n=1 Tax=Dictyocaulus viviparus TaxID=29172 RepID=A0A0D8XWE3_DICVI|nr:hypothetical protein DICVIV_05751 [Dictyocaulus viviparus]
MTCSMIFVQCDRSPCPMVTRCVPTVCEYNVLYKISTVTHCHVSRVGITDDVSSPYFDEVDDFIGMYELGFSLTGPQILPSTRRQAELALGHFLSERFFIPISSINEVIIMNDNTVRFIVKHAKANVIAKNISEAVTSGLEINLNGNYYRAEPHTWFSHQIVEAESLKTAKAIFWALCSIVIVIAVIIFITLCGTCASMYRSASNTTENSTEYIASQLDFATQSTPRDRSQRCQQPYPRHNDSSHLPSRSTQIRLAQSIPEIPLISIDRQFVPHLRSM